MSTPASSEYVRIQMSATPLAALLGRTDDGLEGSLENKMTNGNRAPIAVCKVGHVVLKVSSLGIALDFYAGILGRHEVARRDFGEGPMAFLSTGNSHHDLALVQAGPAARPDGTLGLHHVARAVARGRSLSGPTPVRGWGICFRPIRPWRPTSASAYPSRGRSML